MKVVFLSLASIIALSGCSTANNKIKENKSSKTTLVKEIDSYGVERFSFSVDFMKQDNEEPKAKPGKTRRRLNPQRVQGSSKKAPAEQKVASQSNLEQQALAILGKSLNKKKWCTYGYEVDEKYWQNSTFRILGHCID